MIWDWLDRCQIDLPDPFTGSNDEIGTDRLGPLVSTFNIAIPRLAVVFAYIYFFVGMSHDW